MGNRTRPRARSKGEQQALEEIADAVVAFVERRARVEDRARRGLGRGLGTMERGVHETRLLAAALDQNSGRSLEGLLVLSGSFDARAQQRSVKLDTVRKEILAVVERLSLGSSADAIEAAAQDILCTARSKCELARANSPDAISERLPSKVRAVERALASALCKATRSAGAAPSVTIVEDAADALTCAVDGERVTFTRGEARMVRVLLADGRPRFGKSGTLAQAVWPGRDQSNRARTTYGRIKAKLEAAAGRSGVCLDDGEYGIPLRS
jgi:hypothetical protein